MKLVNKLLILALALLIASCESKKTTDYSTEPAIIVMNAAEDGDADAQCELGLRYARGEGVAQDDEIAANWFSKAAIQEQAEAQFWMGLYYLDGNQGEEAIRWIQKSAENGFVDAQFFLGYCYENGNAVKRDLKESVKWYKKAAKKGSAEAKEALKKLGTNE